MLHLRATRCDTTGLVFPVTTDRGRTNHTRNKLVTVASCHGRGIITRTGYFGHDGDPVTSGFFSPQLSVFVASPSYQSAMQQLRIATGTSTSVRPIRHGAGSQQLLNRLYALDSLRGQFLTLFGGPYLVGYS